MGDFVQTLTEFAATNNPHPNQTSPILREARRLFADAELLDKTARCAQPTAQYPAVATQLSQTADFEIVVDEQIRDEVIHA